MANSRKVGPPRTSLGYDPYKAYPNPYPPAYPNPYPPPPNPLANPYPPYSPRFQPGSLHGTPIFSQSQRSTNPSQSPVYITVQVGLPVANDDLRLHVNELLREVSFLREDNRNLHFELDYVRTLFNSQGTHIARTEARQSRAV